ncbi:hypothetical protein ACJ41O_012280 [Fusarium nematophilum]
MTYRVRMLVYRNPNMTRSQFMDHYENKHILLMKSLTGKSFPISHWTYVHRSGADKEYAAAVLGGTPADFEYDCLSVLEFENDEAFKSMFALLASSELASVVGEDCMTFMDPGTTKVVVLGETNMARRDD